MAQRIFHDLLSRVGDAGRYQHFLILYFCFMGLPSLSAFFLTPFLFYQQEYSCPSSVEECKQFVCALPEPLRKPYISDSHPTMLSQFGDYRCASQGYLTLLKTVIFLGAVVGSAVGVFLVRCLTQRKMVLLSSLLCSFGIVGTLIAPTLVMSCLCLCLVLSGATLQMEIFISYVVETTSQQLRSKGVLITFAVFCAAAWVAPTLFLLIPWWQVALAINILLPQIILIVFWFVFLEETPLQLVTNYHSEYVIESLKRVAHINQVQFTVSEDEVRQIRQEYDQNQREKRKGQPITLLDMCRYKSLRLLSIIFIVFRFVLGFQFYSQQVLIDSFASNIYFNGIILGISQMISNILALLLLECLPRKPVLVIFSFSSAALILPLLLFLACMHKYDCSELEKTLQSVGLFLLKFINSLILTFLYIYKTEVFPSQIRPVALQVTALSGKMGILIIPAVQLLFTRMNYSIFIAFLVVAIVMGLLALPFSQTFGIPPPQMIKELEYQEQRQRHLSVQERLK